VSLVHPQALWLLAVLPAIWALAYASRDRHLAWRLDGATALRSVALALLALALAQPQVQGRDRTISVAYVVDVSRSVSPEFLRRSIDWIRAANARYRPREARFVAFADRPQRVDSIDGLLSVAVSPDARPGDGAIVQAATDIEQALRAALAGFGPYGARRVVLITDGNQTLGDLWRMLPRLQENKVRVYAVPAPSLLEADAWVDGIVVPLGVRQQEPVAIEVRVQALGAMRARVGLRSGERLLGARSVALRAGRNDIAIPAVLRDAGLNLLTASVQAEGDRFEDNDTLEEGAWVAPRPRVLYVEGLPESAHYLADALRARHFDVTVGGADLLATQAGGLSRFDALVVSDVPPQEIAAASANAIEAYVREGGGLIYVAGESTFGKGGLSGGALERVLPVRFEGRRKRLDLDLVLLIDRSHSMRGRMLEQAKTAALSTLDLLELHHRLAVVAFDSRAHVVVPLAAVGNRRRAEDLIASMTARGQTAIYPALAEARRLLADSTATTRHVILLSDGITAQVPADRSNAPSAAEIQRQIQRTREEDARRDGRAVTSAEPAELPPESGPIETLAAELAVSNVTVTTVAIGKKPNLALMSAIAAAGRGRGYQAASEAEIPELFVNETRRLLGEAMVEQEFRPVVAHRVAALEGLDFAGGPPLRGMVVARPKKFSDVLLRGPQQRPLLATTHYGLGKTVAFLSDAKNRWSSEWIGWDGFGRFWAQLVRDTIPRSESAEIALRVGRIGPEASVELRALGADRSYRSGLSPVVRVTEPSGRTSMLALRQVAPGHYAAQRAIEAGYPQPYRFELTEGGGVSARDVQSAGRRSLSYAWSDEFRALPPDVYTLRALSERTGGVFAPTAADIFSPDADAAAVPRPLWPFLVAVGLGLFLLEILWRRMPWDPRSALRRRTGYRPASVASERERRGL
jgi:Mg-chelatase subunit ChlD